MARPIVHVEIPAADPQTLGEFYKNTFGWNLARDPQFNYLQFAAEGGPAGAFVQGSGQFWAGAGPNSPILYIGTDDLSGDLAKVEAAGCTVLITPMEIPGVGSMGMFRDPSGNHIGLFQYLNQPAAS